MDLRRASTAGRPPSPGTCGAPALDWTSRSASTSNARLELVLALLAVLQGRRAYLPLDPADPGSAWRLLIEDAGVRRILTQAGLGGRAAGEKVFLDEFEEESADPLPAPDPDGLAYVLYTSGSTGRPKGVAVPHRAVARLVGAPRQRASPAWMPSETLLQLAPVAFDASTLEIWGALANGGRLAVAPAGRLSVEEIGAAVERHAVTTLWLDRRPVPAGRPTSSSRACGGSASSSPGATCCRPRRSAAAWRSCRGLRLINGYGPTENTTFTCTHAMDSPSAVESPVPIGRPVAGTDVWIARSPPSSRCRPGSPASW